MSAVSDEFPIALLPTIRAAWLSRRDIAYVNAIKTMKNSESIFLSNHKRRLLCLILIISLFLCGCNESSSSTSSAGKTRGFVDSLGREVTLPIRLEKIAMTGPLTQLYLFPLSPDRLAGFSEAFSENARKYIQSRYLDLPELGQLHGGKGTMNLEELIAVSPDVVIDVGEPKIGMAEEFDRLTKQTGIPFLHIDADIVTAPDVYRMLGSLTGDTEKAERLAEWCEKSLAEIDRCMEKVDAEGKRKRILYCMGSDGLNVLAKGSYHAQIISRCAENCAVTDRQVSNGDGVPVDMEQLMLWDADVILFRHDSIYDEVAESGTWRQLRAIKDNAYYRIPCGPYGWISSPPAVQCYLGMLWLADTLYPDCTDFDLKTEVKEYYRLFYGYELSDSDYEELVRQTAADADNKRNPVSQGEADKWIRSADR